jgi:hypothetical protein
MSDGRPAGGAGAVRGSDLVRWESFAARPSMRWALPALQSAAIGRLPAALIQGQVVLSRPDQNVICSMSRQSRSYR